MVDKEKVIEGLHCCAHTDGKNCAYCPYDMVEDCTALMSMDVLDLLKEQDEQDKCLEDNMELKTTIEFTNEQFDELMKLMDFGNFETIQEAIVAAVMTACDKDQESKYYLGTDGRWYKKTW